MGKKIIILLVILAAIVVVVFYLNRVTVPVSVPTTSPSASPSASSNTILYENKQYGFSFELPLSWQNYSIVDDNWQGYLITNETGQSTPDETGPKILIRHPMWTSQVPRQDIPIMIFTLAQWDLVSQEKLAVGAAPFGPSELGRNSTYVFGLPARYNYAFLPGFEEVDQLIQAHYFKAFNI